MDQSRTNGSSHHRSARSQHAPEMSDDVEMRDANPLPPYFPRGGVPGVTPVLLEMDVHRPYHRSTGRFSYSVSSVPAESALNRNNRPGQLSGDNTDLSPLLQWHAHQHANDHGYQEISAKAGTPLISTLPQQSHSIGDLAVHQIAQARTPAHNVPGRNYPPISTGYGGGPTHGYYPAFQPQRFGNLSQTNPPDRLATSDVNQVQRHLANSQVSEVYGSQFLQQYGHMPVQSPYDMAPVPYYGRGLSSMRSPFNPQALPGNIQSVNPHQIMNRLLPPVQQWSVTPAHHPTLAPIEPVASVTSAIDTTPSPDQVKSSALDKRSLRKQRAFRKKADAMKRSNSKGAGKASRGNKAKHTNTQTSSEEQGLKRKASVEIPRSTEPPAAPNLRDIRPAWYLGPESGTFQRSMLQSPYSQSAMLQPYSPQHTSRVQGPGSMDRQAPAVEKPAIAPEKQIDWDNIYQPIVIGYEQYKWSVKVYEIDVSKTGCEFAQSWLENVVSNLKSPPRIFAHTSTGFIKDGSASSLIVLHNATNPYEFGEQPKTTTTIGTYGYHWREHQEIHWVTYAPGLGALFPMWEIEGSIKEVKKWTVDMKPIQKRFHRAYWLAANRRKLGNLLNTAKPEQVPEAPVRDEYDEDFKLTEDDITNEWGATHYETMVAWERIQEEAACTAEEEDHVVTWSSEW